MTVLDEPWLDMTVFPDGDPDAVLSGDALDALREALSVNAEELPDALWDFFVAMSIDVRGTGVAGDPAHDLPDPR